MKAFKFVPVILAMSLILTMLAGCGSDTNKDSSAPDSAASETPVASEPPVQSAEPASNATENAVDFNGTYKCVVSAAMGDQEVYLIVTTDTAGNVTGSYNNCELTSGLLTGNQFELKTEVNNPSLGVMEVVIAGTVEGDSVNGTVTTVATSGTLTGTRE